MIFQKFLYIAMTFKFMIFQKSINFQIPMMFENVTVKTIKHFSQFHLLVKNN